MAIMNSPLMALLAAVCGLTAAIRVPVSYDDTPSSCLGPTPSKVLLCYYNGELSLKKLDPCLCSHLIFTSAATIHHKNYTLNLTTDVGKATRELRKRNPELRVLVSLGGDSVSTDVAESLVKSGDRRALFSSSVNRIVKEEELNGIHIDFKLEAKGGSRNSKGGLVALAKLLRKEMGVEKSRRSKRDYSVFEEIDDISTTAWTPFSLKSSGGTRDVRRAETRTRVPHRPILRSTRTDNDSHSRELLRQSYLALEQHTPKDRLIMVNVPTQPEVLVKRYDLKTLSKYVDLFTVPTHNLSDSSEDGVTYHPSRLMGLADILNTDSLLDLLTGLGAPHDKLVITIPATATKFTLKDPEQNTPRSPTISDPETITQTELCAMISAGGWTIERDEDLTAPYAFKNGTWLAFDDRISVGIKSKYVLLRDLAGAALYTVDSADWSGSCLEENGTDSKAPRLLHSLHHAFTSLARKSRGAVLETLQEDIRTSTLLTFSGDVQLSPYRIVRIVDNLGAVHVVRKDARTEFECSRQGYFRHPLGCNRFYRCVKFDQYSADFTVFEYDCPDGLAFDERWEVCVWPGSLTDGACHGSSEIAPVPKARFVCPAVEGYYADPENCRWFFACLDHSRDGVAPLTAYEFRCPFGLVFDERNLLCQWPWLVEGCGNIGIYSGSYFGAVGFGSAASRGYVASAQDGYVAGGAVVGSAFGAGSRFAQGSGAAIVTESDTGAGLLSGGATLVKHGSGFSAGYEAGQGVILQDANSGENVVTGYAAGPGRGSIKYTTDEGAQLASSYIAGGRSSQRFGNAGSYNEGRHISSYATFPDSLISGGRIENSGGVVLEQNIAVQGIGSEFGLRSGGAAGQGAGLIGTVGTADTILAKTTQVSGVVPVQTAVPVATYERTAHGNTGARFSGGIVSSVPVQTAVPVTTYQRTAHGNAGAHFSGGIVSSVPVQAAVPVQTAVPVTTYQRTAHGNAGAHFSGGIVSSVPVQAAVPVQTAVPVTTYEQTSHGNAGEYFSGDVVSSVPIQTAVPVKAAVPIQTAIPVATYEQTAHGNAGAQFSGGVVSSVPVQAAVPVQTAVPVATYQQTAHGNAGAQFSSGGVSSVPVQAAVSVQTAVPVATYQQTAHVNAGAPFSEGVVSSVPVETGVPVATFEQNIIQAPKAAVVPAIFRKPVVSQVPVVQPIAQAVPVTTYQQTIAQTPAVPVTTYRRPALARIPVVQPSLAPVPVQTVVQQPLAPVVPISRLRKPSFESVAVTSVVPVVDQAPLVPVSRLRKPSFESVAVTPVGPVFEQAAPIVPAVGQPIVPQIQVNTAPVVAPTYRRTKLRPITYQTVTTPAPTVIPLQNDFSQVTDTGYVTQGGYSLRGRPVVSNGGAAGISVPITNSNLQTVVPVTPVPAVNVASYTPAPAVIPSGYVSSTPAPAVISGGFVSSTPAPAVVSGGPITGYSSGSYVSASSPVVTGSVIQNVPAVKSGVYSYSTPVTAVFTGGPSVLPSVRTKSRVPIGRFSYSTPATQVYSVTPASDIVTGGTISVTPVPIKTQSLPVGGTVPILRAGLAPAVGYTQTQPSVNFATDREVTFKGISLASGLEPALYDNSPNLAAGLEIPYSTVRPVLVGSGNIGASRSRVVPTSNIQIGDIQGNGYISSTVSPPVSVTTGVPLPGSYFRGQGTILSTTAAPIQPADINTGGFRARTSHQGGTGTFISAFPGAVPVDNERYIPIINDNSRSYLPPSTVAPVPSYSTERARGRARPYNGQVTNFVSSTPVPEISSPRIVYPSTPRPTFYQAVTTPRPVTFTVSTPVPISTKVYLPPVGTVTPAPAIQTSTLGYQTAGGFGSRANGAASERKTTSRTGINYDNENVEALLDKYSGKFGGLLDNNKEGFVTGVITDDLVGRGRISQSGRGSGAQRGRIAAKGRYSTTAGYNDGGISTVFGSRNSYSTQPSVDSGASTLGAVEYTRSRGGFSTTASPDFISTTAGTGQRGNVRYGPASNVDADGGIGYEAVTLGYDGIKSRSRDNPVVVITRLSDVNPLLVAKLGAQCTCKSNALQLKRPQGYSRNGPSFDDSLLDDVLSRSGTFGTPEHIQSAPLPGSELVTGSGPDFTSGVDDSFPSTTPVPLAPVTLTTPKSAVFLKAVGLDNLGVTPAPSILVASARPRARPGVTYAIAPSIVDVSPFVTSERSRVKPQVISAPAVPLVQVNSVPRSRTRPVVISTTAIPVVPVVSTTAIPAVPLVSSTPYSDSGYLRTGSDESGAGLDAAARAGIGAGRSFDRYGPGGWRGVDETLQGSVDCQRAGLFRHPKYCNKFYACHWDEWKGRFTLHVFNCPVHLAYDTSLGACNWPSKGPACTDDNLLV